MILNPAILLACPTET